MSAVDAKTGTATVAERLADHVVGLRFEDLPAEVVEKTKDLLVYHLALAFAGRSKLSGQQAIAFSEVQGPSAGTSTIVGDRRRARPVDAVLAHSGLINAASWHDFTMPSGLHPGVVSHPPAWVLGEAHQRSGKELITAVVAGYDAGCKVADAALGFKDYTRRRGHIFGPLVAVGTAARMLQLDRETSIHAIGIAAHCGMGVTEGSDISWYLYPLNSRLGTAAAYLAQLGARAAPQTIEGEHGFFRAFFGDMPQGFDASLPTLGKVFAVTQASTKRYHSSGMNIVAIEQMLEVGRSGIREPDVTELVAYIPEYRRARDSYFEPLIEQPEPSAQHAMGSLRFQLALILADGEIDDARYGQFHDPAIQAALRKVRLEYEPGHSRQTYTRLDLTMRDGTHKVVEAEKWDYPKGDWGAWLREDGERFLTAGRLAELERLLTDLEDVPDVGEVIRRTVPDRE